MNNVWPHDGAIFTCGTRLGSLWQIRDDRLAAFATVPYGTHNARPFRDGVLFNHTESDRIVFADREGDARASLALPSYPNELLEHADLPGDLARPTFGRGLAVLGGSIVIGGSSPATLSAYDLDGGERIASVASRWTCATRFTGSKSGPSTGRDPDRRRRARGPIALPLVGLRD